VDSLFGLAPDGVFRAASLALRAVRSYRTFSPSPPACADGCLFSVALSVETSSNVPPACIPADTSPGYAASRPAVFGLSSPGLRQERSSALPKPLTAYFNKDGFSRDIGETIASLGDWFMKLTTL